MQSLLGLISRRPGQGSSASRSSKQRRALERATGLEVLSTKWCKSSSGLTSQSVAVARASAGVRCYLTVLSYLHSLTLRGPLSGRVTARAAKPAAEWFLRAKRGTLRVGDCVYTAPGPSGGTAGVPEVRADSVQGLAGRGRGYPRVSSGSDMIGDPTPASGRYRYSGKRN